MPTPRTNSFREVARKYAEFNTAKCNALKDLEPTTPDQYAQTLREIEAYHNLAHAYNALATGTSKPWFVPDHVYNFCRSVAWNESAR